jgi:hypothetical protein
MAGVTDAALARARADGQVLNAVPIDSQRFAMELPASAATERVLADLTASGAQLVSLTPVRETLEDFFMRQVSAAAHR